MRFLACVQVEMAKGDKWASPGEPVMPNFPTGYANSFLGTATFRPAMRAAVAEFDGLDPDEMAERLHRQFPGLPRKMLDAYVLETAKVAYAMPLGAECNVYTTWDSAKVMNLNTGELHVLWEQQPL